MAPLPGTSIHYDGHAPVTSLPSLPRANMPARPEKLGRDGPPSASSAGSDGFGVTDRPMKIESESR